MPSLPANRQRLCSYSPHSSLSAASLLLKPWNEDQGGHLQICLVSHAAHIKLLRSQEPYVMRGPQFLWDYGSCLRVTCKLVQVPQRRKQMEPQLITCKMGIKITLSLPLTQRTAWLLQTSHECESPFKFYNMQRLCTHVHILTLNPEVYLE